LFRLNRSKLWFSLIKAKETAAIDPLEEYAIAKMPIFTSRMMFDESHSRSNFGQGRFLKGDGLGGI
jgi:hypothetical protein